MIVSAWDTIRIRRTGTVPGRKDAAAIRDSLHGWELRRTQHGHVPRQAT